MCVYMYMYMFALVCIGCMMYSGLYTKAAKAAKEQRPTTKHTLIECYYLCLFGCSDLAVTVSMQIVCTAGKRSVGGMLRLHKNLLFIVPALRMQMKCIETICGVVWCPCTFAKDDEPIRSLMRGRAGYEFSAREANVC